MESPAIAHFKQDDTDGKFVLDDEDSYVTIKQVGTGCELEAHVSGDWNTGLFLRYYTFDVDRFWDDARPEARSMEYAGDLGEELVHVDVKWSSALPTAKIDDCRQSSDASAVISLQVEYLDIARAQVFHLKGEIPGWY